MGKIIKSIIVTLALCLLLTGCSQRECIVYQSDTIIISRSSAQVCVVSADSNKVYTFTLKRTRRAKNATVAAKTILKTDNVSIDAVGGMWIIHEREKTVYIRW